MPDEVRRMHQARCDLGGGQPVTTSVVVSVSAVAGVEPTALPPLQETVDTDALEAVVRSAHDAGAALRVSFAYAGFHVEVEADGSIRIGETVAGG